MPFLMPSQQCRRTEGIWRPSIGLTILCFYSKTGFWPSYCQISTDLDKICTHLLLYGIHLWANLDCDRHMGGSRPNQNDYVFCNTCKCCCEKFRNFVAWAEPDKTAFFFRFRGPFNSPEHALQETVLPQTSGTDGKPRLWRCAFC